MNKLYILTLLVSLFLGRNLFSQEQESQLDSVLDAILFEDEDLMKLLYNDVNYHFLLTRINYNSKSLYAGRAIGPDQFDLTGQVHYFNSSGFNIGIAGVAYSAFRPRYNTTIISAGYFHNFKRPDALSIRTSYTRYFFERVDSIESSTFNSSLNFGSSFTKKHFGTSVDASILFGDDFSTQFDIRAWGSFNLIKFGNSNKLSFEPDMSVFLGNQTAIYGQFGVDASKPWYTIASRQTDVFGLMNTEFSLPFTLSIKDFDFEAGYYLDFPRALGAEPKIDPVSYFGISLSYLFDLGKK